jgi:hypothetical protein
MSLASFLKLPFRPYSGADTLTLLLVNGHDTEDILTEINLKKKVLKWTFPRIVPPLVHLCRHAAPGCVPV